MNITKGEKFLVAKDFEAEGTLFWKGPMSSSFNITLSKGMELECVQDLAPFATAFYAKPTAANAVEEKLFREIAKQDVTGYALVIDLKMLGKFITKV